MSEEASYLRLCTIDDTDGDSDADTATDDAEGNILSIDSADLDRGFTHQDVLTTLQRIVDALDNYIGVEHGNPQDESLHRIRSNTARYIRASMHLQQSVAASTEDEDHTAHSLPLSDIAEMAECCFPDLVDGVYVHGQYPASPLNVENAGMLASTIELLVNREVEPDLRLVVEDDIEPHETIHMHGA